ncbi:MAG: CRISPR-associated endoribonuclease Cas6 [Methanococcaceae archaeon]
MRLILKLKAIKEKEFTYNYNYSLYEEISKLLKLNTAGFKEFLREKGFRFEEKEFRFFTFALNFENVVRHSDKLQLRSQNARLLISFPLIDQYVSSFVLNDLTGKTLTILQNYPNAIFMIKNVCRIEEPLFKDGAMFFPKSPLILSERIKTADKQKNCYYTYKDDPAAINRVIKDDLVLKYKILHGRDLSTKDLSLDWDLEYVNNSILNNRKTTINLMINLYGKNKKITGSMVPFVLKGNPELIRTGYDCGFGKMNSLGFGLAESAD